VMLSHNNITSNCEQVQASLILDLMGPQETLPGVLPFFHIYGLTVVMLSKLGQGCRLATMPCFKPDMCFSQILVDFDLLLSADLPDLHVL